jgi:methionine-rich copper-binding protein CopC
MNRIAIAAALVLLTPVAAFAHAHLVSADPGAGATVHSATTVTITFTEAVEPQFSTIAVTDPDGATVSNGTAQTDPKNAKILSIPVTAAKPGTYQVVWHATAVDTHKTEGVFTFTVGN